MIGKCALTALACIALSWPAFAQGGGGGAGGAGGAGSAASSGAGVGTSSSSANSGPSAPSGMGTQGTTTGANVNTNSNVRNNPNVQPPTPNGTSPAAAQAERNAGVGHSANGLPIGSPGTGTSNEDQK